MSLLSLSPASEPKEHSIEISQDLYQHATNDFNTEMEQPLSQWKRPSSPQPKKAQQSFSSIKSVHIILFSIRDIYYSTSMVSRISIPETDRDTNSLLQCFKEFVGGHSVKATRSMGHEKLNSLQ